MERPDPRIDRSPARKGESVLVYPVLPSASTVHPCSSTTKGISTARLVYRIYVTLACPQAGWVNRGAGGP
jgi:hypothetical protein